MGIFGNKKETTEKKATTAPKALATDHNLDSVLIGPRLIVKAMLMSDNNVYTFLVRRDATKYQVRDAIKAFYNVTPVKVNIVNKKPSKRFKRSRGKMVRERGEKKAYVYLKKGDTISLV